MPVIKPNATMPSCNKRDQQKILNVIDRFSPSVRNPCEDLIEDLGGAKTLCQVLHGIRRWYTYNTGSAAWKVIPHVGALSYGMDLDPPVGAYRGFKVDKNSSLAELEEGDELSLSVTRNAGCSSWTLGRDLANKFSGASRGKIGLVIKLVSGAGVKAFIAPPEHCTPWFNRLYAETMGRSHRHSEREYAIYAPRIRVRVVAVKRR